MDTTAPRLVVLDGFALNPGDLSWEKLLSLGNCSIYERTSPEAIVSEAAEAELLLTNKAVLSKAVIEALPRLKYIGVMATGFNGVDAEAARERGIPVTNVPIYSTQSVAQMVFSHMLHFAQRVGDHSNAVHAGRWSSANDFCFWDSPQVELAGLTLGIVGWGRIGKATAKLAAAFGMNVLVTSRSTAEMPAYAQAGGPRHAFLRQRFCQLALPIDARDRTFRRRRPPTNHETDSRAHQYQPGPVGRRASFGIRARTWRPSQARGSMCLSSEPPPEDHPLLGVKNCVITPHIAWATQAARSRLMDTVVENVAAFLAGRPQERCQRIGMKDVMKDVISSGACFSLGFHHRY